MSIHCPCLRCKPSLKPIFLDTTIGSDCASHRCTQAEVQILIHIYWRESRSYSRLVDATYWLVLPVEHAQVCTRFPLLLFPSVKSRQRPWLVTAMRLSPMMCRTAAIREECDSIAKVTYRCNTSSVAGDRRSIALFTFKRQHIPQAFHRPYLQIFIPIPLAG